MLAKPQPDPIGSSFGSAKLRLLHIFLLSLLSGMRLTPSEPDVQTLILRIKDGDINLQPDFQRGEVWPTKKKQRLIDTILRRWHIPPVHLIELPDQKFEVLDGQQRLIAVRDFANDAFPIDGSIEPTNENLALLNGLRYSQLPNEVKRLFHQYAIRVIGVTDYDPAEVGELFLRLNQPANLTTAEQRNAFFGEARSQIKGLVKQFRSKLFIPETVGFSNSRMAYDDVVARLCFTIELGDLWKKVGASDITTKYRSRAGFAPLVIERAENAMALLDDVVSRNPERVRFNKATLFSWLLFYDGLLRTSKNCDPAPLRRHLAEFESARSLFRDHVHDEKQSPSWEEPDTRFLILIFNDRASARVADVLSVVMRDFVLWFTLTEQFQVSAEQSLLPPNAALALRLVKSYFQRHPSGEYSESSLEEILSSNHWRPL